MKSLDGRGITATFDPLGVFVRQWRFTDVRVQSGDVEIQIYKANPEAVAPKPWFSIFLPNRVYLKKIESEQANITWQFRGERAGFFGTQLAQKKSFEHLALNDCSLSFGWNYPKIEINNIAIEERGKFRIEGEMSIEQRRLRGTIRLGLTREYLDWLPNPEEVFSRKQDGYLWTNVRLFGTIDDPGQDLSPRIIELFKQSPGAYLILFFRQFEGWLKRAFGSDH